MLEELIRKMLVNYGALENVQTLFLSFVTVVETGSVHQDSHLHLALRQTQ